MFPDKLVWSNFHVMPRIPGSFFLRNLVGRRSLLFQLVRRDFEQRFVGSIIGWVWALIHPLVLLVCWWFVFSVSLKVAVPPGEGTRNYALFVFAGMLPWLLFSESVQRSGINMQRFNANTPEEGTGLFHIALRVKDRIQLIEVMASLRKVRGVLTVERVRGSVFGKVR